VQANARNVSFVVLVVAWCLSRAGLGKSSVFSSDERTGAKGCNLELGLERVFGFKTVSHAAVSPFHRTLLE
jgi:hypothetical protein